VLEDFEQFVERIVTERLPVIRQDLDRFRASLPRRRAWIEKLVARIDELRASPCDLLPIAVNPLEGVIGGERAEDLIRRVEQSLAEAESSYEILSGHFNAYAQSLGERGRIVEQLQADKSQTPEQLFEQLVRGVYNPAYVCGETRILTIDIVEDITRELTELQLLQAIARSEAIELQDIDIRADQALEVARRYRRDWMNARGALVDAWRLVQFNADPLQGFLDVFFSGDIANVSDNPFRLRAGNGRLRVGVQFDAPLTRLAERNIYRQALIEYQQARRSYYAFEDGIARGLRATLRTVTTNQINFELQRMAVLQAARQVMLNAFLEQESQRAQTTRVTAARDAVQAISDLLNAQNDFMSFWVNYEVLRLSLDFNLGTMQLDSEGLWIDPGNIGADYGQYDPWLRWQKETHDGLKVEEIGGQTAPHGQRADPIDELPPPFLLPPAGR
jgi:hypothetical protein